MNFPRKFFQNYFKAIQLCLMIFMFAFISNAQSGRKNKQASPQPTPEISNPDPEVKKKPVEAVKPLFKVKVFNNNRTVGFSQFFSPDKMPVWVTERLRNSGLLDVSSGSSISFKEAKDIAKESTDLYIVLVELYEDQFQSSPTSRSDTIVGDDVYIKYTVFEPGTGKSKYSGQVILYNKSLNRTERLCYPQLSNRDLILLYSSYETAERIMSSFKIPFPAVQCKSPI